MTEELVTGRPEGPGRSGEPTFCAPLCPAEPDLGDPRHPTPRGMGTQAQPAGASSEAGQRTLPSQGPRRALECPGLSAGGRRARGSP